MPLDTANHDKLAYWLNQILLKLNQGEKFDAQALNAEFAMQVRSIQRALKERFAFLLLQKAGEKYFLDASYLGKLSLRDLRYFAALAGVRGLFPSLSNDFLRDIFDSRLQLALLMRSHSYETLDGRQKCFRRLKEAIVGRRCIGSNPHKSESIKTYVGVQPYKLVNHSGIWYLTTRDGARLMSYTLSKIESLQVGSKTFTPDQAVNATLTQEDTIWLSERKIEVVLKVAPESTGYFRRCKFVAGHVIQKELGGGASSFRAGWRTTTRSCPPCATRFQVCA